MEALEFRHEGPIIIYNLIDLILRSNSFAYTILILLNPFIFKPFAVDPFFETIGIPQAVSVFHVATTTTTKTRSMCEWNM